MNVWQVDYTEAARRMLKKLDRPVAERIRAYMKEIAQLPAPRMRGDALEGPLSEFWRYRIGDYRVVCRIEDRVLIVLVVKIAHRREVYKRR